MNNDRMIQLLDDLRSIRAQQKFKALCDELWMSPDENELLESVLRYREQIIVDKQQHEIARSLEKYQVSKIEDAIEQSMTERLNAAKEVLVARHVSDIDAQLEIIDVWLEECLSS